MFDPLEIGTVREALDDISGTVDHIEVAMLVLKLMQVREGFFSFTNQVALLKTHEAWP